MTDSSIGFHAVYRSDPTPTSEVIPEVIAKLQRVRHFYFEDSQVVLQASHSITMFRSAL
jgi:hypothetical protein